MRIYFDTPTLNSNCLGPRGHEGGRTLMETRTLIGPAGEHHVMSGLLRPD